MGDIHTQNMYSDLKEQTTNFYVSLSKNYETGVSFSVSATGEYYTIGNYHKWAVYPQASLTYFKRQNIHSNSPYLQIRRIRAIGICNRLLVISTGTLNCGERRD